MSKKLEGKVALVTGASKGIGAAIAKHLAAEGASIVVNYASSRTGADAVVTDIVGLGGKAVAVQADLSNEADIDRLFHESQNAFGRLDILVNNAGVYEFGSLESVTADSFRRMFDLNVLGLLLTSKRAVESFGSDGGSIINIGSVVSEMAPPDASVYTATKAAVDAITRSLAKELGPKGVRVNALNPGLTATEGTQSAGIVGSDFEAQMISITPLGRIGQAGDMGPLAVFLASSDSSWITGQTIQVAGGTF